MSLICHNKLLTSFRLIICTLLIFPELQEQLRKTTELYEADLKESFAGVFLPDQLEKNTRMHQRSISGSGFFLHQH
jgi:hypothetical protein